MKWFYVLAGVCIAALWVYHCNNPVKVVVSDGKAEYYKRLADSLAERTDSVIYVREVKYRTVVQYRDSWRVDTALVHHYDTTCPELAKENVMLWEIVADDSLIIANQGQVIRYQDSALDWKQKEVASLWRAVDALDAQKRKAQRMQGLSFIGGFGLGVFLRR